MGRRTNVQPTCQSHPRKTKIDGMLPHRSPEGTAKTTQEIRIVDLGRGPQIEGHRLTVMDVFYYLHRGYDFDFIHQAMPSLTREQFDVIIEYVHEHCDELVEQDRRVEEFHLRGMAAQHARGGIFAENDANL